MMAGNGDEPLFPDTNMGSSASELRHVPEPGARTSTLAPEPLPARFERQELLPNHKIKQHLSRNLVTQSRWMTVGRAEREW